MVDISSQNNKINVTVSSSGNTANTNITPDYAQYYSEKSKEWAISNRIVDNIDYSSKYYANESKKQADISTAKATEVVESGNTAVSNIENARDIAVFDVNTAGATQVALATEQATIATNKTSEVVASGNGALANIDTAKDNAITSITNQETTSKTVLIDEGATQVGLIQNEGATQIANVQSTGFYMHDDKLYFINSQGEETEFKSGGGGLELCDIGLALYVDESKGLRRYLNGQIVDINTNTQAFLNRLLQIQTTNPDYFTTEDNWQSEAILNIDGCVYKFVLNYSGDNVASVRLPKYPDYVEINAGGTLPVVGNGLALGLTNGTNDYCLAGTKDNGAGIGNAGLLVGEQSGYNNIGRIALGVVTDPTKSGIETTLKQTKLKMRYFIQIATGQETENNIKNELELINPYSLFEPKYSDVSLYNASWVLSSEAYLSKTVYVTAYEALQVEYNTEIEAGTTVDLPSGTRYTKRGISVKLSTDSSITDYDWVINTKNETFRTPLKSKLVGISRSGNLPVVGNGKTLGFTDGTSFAGSATGGSSDLIARGSAFGASSSGASYTSDTHLTNSKTCGIATASQLGSNLQNSGLIASLENIDITGLYLYFYIGDVAQNANIVDLGRMGEVLADKQDRCIHITETYQNGTSWYRVYSDGWCEQGFIINASVTSITLLKPFTTTTYNVLFSYVDTTDMSSIDRAGSKSANNKTTTSFTKAACSFKMYVQACGY